MQLENSTYHIIRGTILLLIVAGLLGWALIRALKRSGDPARLLFKWVLTAGVIGFAHWKIVPLAAANPSQVGREAEPAWNCCLLLAQEPAPERQLQAER